MASTDLDELIDAPDDARVFEMTVRPGLADCAPSGRLRLDAIARWLQDIAYADVEEAGLDDAAIWVVRRTRIRVSRFPRFGEHLTARTFCSGMGLMWAERRTTIAAQGSRDGAIETVALWVHLDPLTREPARLSDAETAAYGRTGHDRRVTARLRHQPAGEPEAVAAWTFRRTDCDLGDHVNNAAYWQPLEEELLTGPEPRTIDAEIEFRVPSQPGERRILRSGHSRWIMGDNGDAHASVLINASAPWDPQPRKRTTSISVSTAIRRSRRSDQF